MPGSEEIIWFKDPAGFLQNDRLAKFIPEARSPLSDQLNAIMRFALYYGAFIFVFRRSYAAVYVPLVTAAVTYAVYAADEAGDQERESMRAERGEGKDEVTGETCTMPDRSNPFMNVLLSDYELDPARPRACDLSRPAVARAAEAMFEHNLYRDSDDVFNRNASSRSFYTTPSTTIPNDQAGFANWLYGMPRTCKEGNGEMCAVHVHKFMPGT